MRNVAVLLCSLIMLPGAGCDLDGLLQPHSPGAHIVWGHSIDGLQIGDHPTTAQNKLGKPDEIGLGDFPGVSYGYLQGEHAGVRVVLYTDDPNDSGRLGVVQVEVRAPYTGRTQQGIGIGSPRAAVVEAYGLPEEGEIYSFEASRFRIEYTEERISGIVMLPQR